MKRLLLLALLACSWAQAEVIPIHPIEECFLCSTAPSMTMYLQGQNAKAVLIFIPGGEGYLGLKEGQTEVKGQILKTLERLTDPALTSGKYDVVFLDSPNELSPRQPYPSARGSMDHLIRIESAIQYYKKRTALPIWLIGHSNGGISLTEFLKYAQKNNKLDLISGFIASGIRNESYFNAPVPFPILFMHHQNDGCFHTTPAGALSNFNKVKEYISAPTEFAYITSGQAQASDPCRSGFHMYNAAGEEAAKVIDDFMSRIYK